MISTTRPFGKGRRKKALRMQLHQVTLVHDSPRILIVSIRACVLNTHVVVLHAPHGPTAEAVDEWWQQARGIIRRHCQGSLLVCADTNSDAGGAVSTCTGGYGGLRQGKYFDSVLRFMEACGVFAPATYEELADESCLQASFVARGCHAVCDYVFVSAGYSVVQKSARILTTFDIGHEAEDHLPVAVTVVPDPPAFRGICRRRKRPYDRNALLKPEVVAQLNEYIARAPRIAFE
eukprot:7926128-Karenia_brevis.AAC.1